MSKKVFFHIDGMSCQACAARIEKVLNKKEAIEIAEVNYAGERASVLFDESSTTPDQIANWIAAAGFQAALIEPHAPTPRPTTPFPYLAALSWVILIPFLIGMIGMAVGKHFLMMPAPIQFALATIVQFISGAVFYKGAFVALKNKAPNMDVLVALGTTAVWAYSVFMMVKGDWHNVYFEASVMVIALVSLGKYLELRVKRNSLNSIALLTQLVPKEVEVLRHKEWQKMPLNRVRMNDIVRAKQGEKIAADGIVINGEAWCDESHLTGEPNAIHKKNQAKVFAGAIVNNGSVEYRVEALGQATILGDMIKALDDAQNSKAPVARLADKVAAVFVPFVIAVALLTFFLNYSFSGSLNVALMRAAAVLVIACPCALGLATPAAIMAGMGVAAKYGILFKDAAAMETAGKIDTVVFDKTGTLTVGKPQVVAFRQPEQAFIYSENDFIQVAASIEARVSHPLATAIVQYAKSKNLPFVTVDNIEVVAGQGVSASVVNFGEVKIGTPEFCGFTLPEISDSIWQTCSIVAISMHQEKAAFAITDALREDSKEAISRLQNKNIHTTLFSGDKETAVAAVANILQIENSRGNMLPRDKAQAIVNMKKQGHTVAMVGDGINDAAALAAADTGFALKSGTDIAQHTANATLMNGSANQVADAVIIARKTLNTIRQNLFFAFIYNIIGIPLAAIGILSPAIAGAAMAASSISVLGNAVRLKKFRVK
ncbi:MAG: heavy metal translocating P-type ATPase [Neisseriaceae bacterium]|nr:heavy metal translocating P-type ATPase [Neisseriaceae bacterium]